MPFGQTCSKMNTCEDSGEPVRNGTSGDITRRRRSAELEPIPDEAESQDFVLELRLVGEISVLAFLDLSEFGQIFGNLLKF